jgi:hypothetical protein
MGDDKLVKVLLHNGGEDVETPWGEDLGPAPGGGRRVRLDNVPFLHAKPTFGDVIVVREDERYEGQLAWDRDNVPWDQIGSRIEQDGGRYAMIVDYRANDVDKFGLLAEWLSTGDIVPEGCFGPRDQKPGRLYLAVPKSRGVAEVIQALGENELGFTFMLIHPEIDRGPKPRAETVRGVVPVESSKRPAPPRAPSATAAKPARAATASPVAKSRAATAAPVAKPVARPAAKPADKPSAKPRAQTVAAKPKAKVKPATATAKAKAKANALAAKATSAVKAKAARAKAVVKKAAATATSAARAMAAKGAAKKPAPRAKTAKPSTALVKRR